MEGLTGLGLTSRAFWMIVHLAVGAVFIHGFVETVLGLRGTKTIRPMAIVGGWSVAIIAWITVITGTWIVYPWYRAKPPAGADTTNYPQAYLVSHPNLAGWHEFGMEWKEHVGWITPILATAVAFVIFRYGPQLAREVKIRRALITLLVVAFGAALVAGGLGAFINKMAPNTFLNLS
jgi:hypothetical protein